MWELGSINQHISVVVHLPVLLVSQDSWDSINGVVKEVLRMIPLVDLLDSLNSVTFVLETWGKNQSLVAQSLSVGQLNFLFVGANVLNSSGLNSAPLVNVSGDSSGHKVVGWNITNSGSVVTRWVCPLDVWGHEGHLVWNVVSLQELGQTSCVQSTNNNNVEFGLISWHWWLGRSESHLLLEQL